MDLKQLLSGVAVPPPVPSDKLRDDQQGGPPPLPVPSMDAPHIELVGVPAGIRMDETSSRPSSPVPGPEDPALQQAVDAIGEGAPCLICLTYLDGESWRHVVTAHDFPTSMLSVAFREYRRQRAAELGG